jgi:serine/threonine protein kinase/tetratricopeptide (TPR) repeat protein
MEPERWAAIESLYHAALEQEPAGRSSWLHHACGGDSALRGEVESLLACAGANLSNPAARSDMAKLWGNLAADPDNGVPALPSALPPSIGRYRILRLLGEGGMGIVYEAEQEQPRRTVALKVIKSGLRDPKLIRRFEQESLVLGRLQHPGIAQIYEAGAAENGFGPQPYFAMEFVRGESLLQYADAHGLGLRQKLELMEKVCGAVHHAHQRGIIHRDLKPGNILVDETGQPKILDFGVARATDSDARATQQTDLGQLVGTLAYMSPEQVLADPLELDMRSDVYALGVILYELLAGRAPYKISSRLHEAVQTIREEEPRPLGTADSAYRGDIETIAAKAMDKDKSRRYASAAELAADIRRYLQDEPIMARPASATYQVKKFARRHKALVLGVAAVFLVLVAGIIVSAQEAARANAESATSRAISDFLQNDLLAQASAANQSGPRAKPDPDLKVRTALDRAAARIAGKFNRQPEVEAAIRDTIGQTYMDLGLYPEARTQLQRALDLHSRVLGEQNPETLRTMYRIGYVAFLQGKYSEAEALLGKTLEIRRGVLGPEHPDTLSSMNYLATVYWAQGKYAQAEALHSETLAIRRRTLGAEHLDTLSSMNNLAIVYWAEEKYAKAEMLDGQILEILPRVLGPEHPKTLATMNNLAIVYSAEGKYAQSAALYSKALEIQRRVLGPEHPTTLLYMHNLATAYDELRKYGQAEALNTQALESQRRLLGPEHPNTASTMHDLANDYVAEQKYAQAEAMFGQAMEIRRRALGSDHPDTLNSMNGLADAYASQGKYKQAEALFIPCLIARRRVLGPENAGTLSTLACMASMYQRQARYSTAESYFAQVLAGRRRTLSSEHTDTMAAAEDLAMAYQFQGKFTEAEPLAREALEFNRRKQPDDWRLFRAEGLLGASLAGQAKYAAAERLLLEGHQGMVARKDQTGADEAYDLRSVRQWLVELYQAWGKPTKAAEWKKKLRK